VRNVRAFALASSLPTGPARRVEVSIKPMTKSKAFFMSVVVKVLVLILMSYLVFISVAKLQKKYITHNTRSTFSQKI
jgi:hypothetical protein